MKTQVSRIIAGFFLITGGVSTLDAQATTLPCNSSHCDVTKFSGTTDEKIAKAMRVAALLPHKTVYFPAGKYYLKQTIAISNLTSELSFIGASAASGGTKLISSPIYSKQDPNDCYKGLAFGPVFNINAQSNSIGGFTKLKVQIKNLEIDMSPTRKARTIDGETVDLFNHPDSCSAGHGIRVGTGWKEGSLHIENVRIYQAAGYGIGIQNDEGLPANNVTIRTVEIVQSGSDGFDSKRPPAGNFGLTMADIVVHEIGYRDERSAAALDISYDNYSIRNVTIITAPTRANALGISNNTGIRIRNRTTGKVQNGVLSWIYIKGANDAIYYEDGEHTTIKNAIIKEYARYGLVVNGQDHYFNNGCVFSSRSAFSWYIDPSTRHITNNFADTDFCEELYGVAGAQVRIH